MYNTKEAVDSLFIDYDNISIGMSVDEYHLQVLKRIYKNKIIVSNCILYRRKKWKERNAYCQGFNQAEN